MGIIFRGALKMCKTDFSDQSGLITYWRMAQSEEVYDRSLYEGTRIYSQ